MYTSRLITVLFSLFLAACSPPNPAPDLIIHNAEIWTGNEAQPYAEAMAIRADTILAVGSGAEIMRLVGEGTTTTDLAGAFVIPGFTDSHVHLLTGGRSLLSVDLRSADSPQEFTRRIADFAKQQEAGEWILEGNWDHTLWGGELPNRSWIDAETPDSPVVVFRLDWHMVLANSAALKFCGIDAAVEDVEGGEILRNPDGSLTGLFKDNAMNLLLDRIPPMTDGQRDRAFAAAADYFLANGVTAVHDVDGQSRDFASVATARRRLAAGKPSVRLYAATPLAEWKTLLSAENKDDKWIKTGALKGFVDGSLGSHTAAFHHDYSDKTGDKGFFINPEPRLHEWIAGADSAGLHVMVHAIGDSAVHTLLDIYERVIEENGPRDRRFRIEHAQHLAPTDIPRFEALGVIASMQPYHAIDDGRWAEEYLGAERIKTTYAFRSLADAGAHLAFGSDWAVAPADPLAGIRAAVYRRTLDGENPDGWVPEQRISAEEALIAYTRNAAFAGFAEQEAGTLVQGKFADFVVLSGNILTGGLDSARVVNTYVGGVRVF